METRLTSLADFNEPFNIVFSIGDIRDISFGSCTKSYTLDIPLTKLNKNLLKFISQSDVKSEPSDPVSLYVDGQLIMKGKLIVLNVDEYTAKVIISADDWMDTLNARKMTDLDLSANDHLLTQANIEASWTASYPMYRYPMIDFGGLVSGTTIWYPNDFILMMSVSQLITKILSPYVIVSTWLATTLIKDLFILAREVIAKDDFITNKALEVTPQSLSDNEVEDTIGISQTKDITLTIDKVLFNNYIKDEASGMTDSGHYYTIPESGTYRFTANILMQNSFITVGEDMIMNNESITLSINQKRGTTITALHTINFTASATNRLNGITYSLDSKYIYLEAGDIVYISLTAVSNLTNNTGSSQTREIYVDATSKLVNVWSNVNKYAGIGQLISLSAMLPDMSQLDFLAAIRDIFNLRFWMDKNNNTIHIEPWDSFISDEIVDLSEFVDYASLPAELISPNYYSTVRMKWTDDTGDQAYVEYLKENTVSPGLVNVNLTSLFTQQGVDIREHQFSGIIIGHDLPRIWDVNPVGPTGPITQFDRMIGFNTRLVHWDGLTDGYPWTFDTISETTYPKISGLQWLDIYNSYWQKFFHWVDKGKLYTITIKIKPSFLAQFMTVINNAESEGFRPRYKITINSVENLFILQKCTSDGLTAQLEMILA